MVLIIAALSVSLQRAKYSASPTCLVAICCAAKSPTSRIPSVATSSVSRGATIFKERAHPHDRVAADPDRAQRGSAQ